MDVPKCASPPSDPLSILKKMCEIRPLHENTSVNHANRFAVFRSCGTYRDRKLVLNFNVFSMGVYESKILFSLPFCKYWSYLQTVSEKKFGFGLKMSVGGVLFSSRVPKIREDGGTPFLS